MSGGVRGASLTECWHFRVGSAKERVRKIGGWGYNPFGREKKKLKKKKSRVRRSKEIRFVEGEEEEEGVRKKEGERGREKERERERLQAM